MAELTDFAWRQQQAFEASTSASDRHARGHFGTPPDIAAFMAQMFDPQCSKDLWRVLDPGAGVGTLSAAVCDLILGHAKEQRVFFQLWESDPALRPLIEDTMQRCRQRLQLAGHWLDFEIRGEDFVAANSQRNLFRDGPSPSFDLAILNPPYYKLRKDSEHARQMPHLVHGQPNIYTLFMGIAADLLIDGGQFVAITPRSYFNGPYFKRFRKWFFDRMTARRIHTFDSRKEAFRENAVLQENVILLAEKRGTRRDVLVTSSKGRDLDKVVRHLAPYCQAVADSAGDHVVRVTSNEADHAVVAALDRYQFRLRSFDLDVSTGPVVGFRATEFLRDKRSDDTAPLLWMHNVRPFVTRGLEKNGKAPHIEVSPRSMRLLLPAKRYVLLKRFTAKEEKRRLVAGIVESGDSYSRLLGLENHLNYLHRRGGDLSRDEAWGLAAYLNSSFVDRYFRAVSGNTQVNAAEIRALPLPEMPAIERIGRELAATDAPTPQRVDEVVGRSLRFEDGLANEISECVP